MLFSLPGSSPKALGSMIMMLMSSLFVFMFKNTDQYMDSKQDIRLSLRHNMSIPTQGIIVYDDGGGRWEVDYIMHDILPDLHATWDTYFFSSRSGIMTAMPQLKENNVPIILVFSSNSYSWQGLRKLVQHLEPVIVFQLSDEWGKSKEFVGLTKDVPLVFRQYSHAHYPSPPNLRQLPLGYMTHMLNGTSSSLDHLNSIKKPMDRTYEWAFVGRPKHDSQTMMQAFEKELPGRSYTFMADRGPNRQVPSEMYDIYKEAVFVPSRRGNVVLDCFRLYEATFSGALPVVVFGKDDEISHTFNYGGDQPPWIYAPDWTSAAKLCRSLLTTPSVLEEMQARNIEWWRRQIVGIRQQIQSTLIEHQQQSE